jgi:hypothetical protein
MARSQTWMIRYFQEQTKGLALRHPGRGVVMKFFSMFLPLTLALPACTHAGVTANSNGCDHLAPADRRATWQIVAPGVWSTGPVVIPRKNRSGSGSFDPDGLNSSICARHEDNQKNPPQIHDLQKIGHARSTPSLAQYASLGGRTL